MFSVGAEKEFEQIIDDFERAGLVEKVGDKVNVEPLIAAVYSGIPGFALYLVSKGRGEEVLKTDDETLGGSTVISIVLAELTIARARHGVEPSKAVIYDREYVEKIALAATLLVREAMGEKWLEKIGKTVKKTVEILLINR